MNLITQSKFKDLVGVTKQAVSQLVQSGRVTSVKKGRYKQIDLDGALTQQYLAEKQDKQAEPITPDVQSGTYNEKRNLEIEKIKEQTEEVRIRNSIKRGDLISKKLVKRAFDRLYSIDENQLKSLGVNASPKISTVYASVNAEKALEICAELNKQGDDETKNNIIKILSSGDSDRIAEINQILEDEIGGVLLSIQREIEKFFKEIRAENKN